MLRKIVFLSWTALFAVFVLNFTACSDDESFIAKPQDGEKSCSSHNGAGSSSSGAQVTGCETCEYGKLKDDRDGQTYRTVKIGDVWWMAENLNFDTILGRCYHDSAEYCEKYGRLYVHSERICPEGWFLPSLRDWYALFEAAGGRTKEDGFSVVTTALRSSSDWRCDDTDCTTGTDAFGFSALPAGYYDDIKNDKFLNEGYMTKFWTSTGEYDNYKVGVTLYDLTQSDYPNYYDIIWEIYYCDMLSIRCIHY